LLVFIFVHSKKEKMKRLFSILVLSWITATSGYAQEKIAWLTIEEAFDKIQTQPKKVLIDVYTDWCGWCKVMDKNTFAHPEVAKYVNEHFYAVKLDAESRKEIILGGNTYKFNASSGAHDIAIALLQGKMSYPSIVYLDEKFNMIQPLPGYMDAAAFHPIIAFIGQDFYKKEPFDSFKEKTYISLFKDILPLKK
jgi:thioredoxin-related protein